MTDEMTPVSSEEVIVKEIIGRIGTIDTTNLWQRPSIINFDKTRTNYEFYDNLRNGMAAGFRLSGLFVPTIITTTVAHVFGQGISAYLSDAFLRDENVEYDKEDVKYTNNVLKRLTEKTLGLLLTLTEDLLSLGDQYLVVNTDGSFSIPSPDTVSVDYDPLDYRNVVAYTIRTKTDSAEIIDRYTKTKRYVTIKAGTNPPVTYEYPELRGIIPVIHFKNRARTNELFGRPDPEPLLRLLERYDALLEKILDGSEVISNPIPTFEGLEDIEGTIRANRTDESGSYMDQQGVMQERTVLHFDRMSAIFVGKGGSFKFAGPLVGFSTDAISMLKHLFQLAMNYSRLPEYVFGGAIASSKASAETQVPPFNQYIRSRRIALEGTAEDDVIGTKARGGLLQVFDIFLRTKRLTDPRIIVAPVKIKWPELSLVDEQLYFNKVKWAKETGLVKDEVALDEINIVDDAEQAVKEAQAEIQAQVGFDNFNTQLNQASDSTAIDLPLDNTSNNNNNHGDKVRKN